MKKRTLCIILILFASLSCKKSEPQNPSSANSDNVWIYEQMKHYYLWNDQLPEQKNTDLTKPSDEYFNSLKNKADRFSYITKSDDATKSIYAATNDDIKFDFGFDYRIVVFTDAPGRYFQVRVVTPGSPADKAGIKRGDLFSKINNVAINSNSKIDGSSIMLTKVNLINLKDVENIPINAGNYTDTPLIYNSIIYLPGKRIGYLVYNHFTAGTNNIFENELKNIFAYFKEKQVTDLILDLRYNPGGEINNAITLASMIVSRSVLDSKAIFSYLDYNALYANELKSKYKEYNITRFGLTKEESDRCNLNLNKIYVIATHDSASASEVTMHCLRQYISSVIHLGEVTVGKQQGSITITDQKNKVKWELHPIVCRIYDKTHTGGYASGLIPDVKLSEDYLDLGNWGNDPMLMSTLDYILPGTKSSQPQTEQPGFMVISNPDIKDRGTIIN